MGKRLTRGERNRWKKQIDKREDGRKQIDKREDGRKQIGKREDGRKQIDKRYDGRKQIAICNNNNNNNLFPSGTVIHYLTQFIKCYYIT